MSEFNPLNIRWEPDCDGDCDDADASGSIVMGVEGCSDYVVLAQAVDRQYGPGIVRDIIAYDHLLAACKAMLRRFGGNGLAIYDRAAVDLAREAIRIAEMDVDSCKK